MHYRLRVFKLLFLEAILKQPKILYGFTAAACLIFSNFISNSATAADVDITARFIPNASNPGQNNFENTTPNGGYCALYNCGNAFSISIPNWVTGQALTAGTGVELKVPYDWRTITLTHTNGDTQEAEVRIVGMGAEYNFQSGGTVNHGTFWDSGSWLFAPTGCTGSRLAAAGNRWYRFFWNFRSTNPCTKTPMQNAPLFEIYGFNIMYEMRTPNPLQMSIGNYTGAISYSVGPTGDFSLGQPIVTDPVLNLNFRLSVQHNLAVQFPANAHRLSMQPLGGWQQWLLYGGQRPQKLIANQNFKQWSSSTFKMVLQCQYPTGDDCSIKSNKNETLVPVQTMVSFTHGVQDSNKKPVNRHRLSNTTPSVFQPTRYVNNEPSTLHFEVNKQGVEEMIKNGGGTYRGDVTIVWDAAV